MEKRIFYRTALVIGIALFINGCKPECDNCSVDATTTLNIVPEIDGKAIEKGKFIYQNAAGNTFSILNVEFYLSDVYALPNLQLSTYQYMSSTNPATLQIKRDAVRFSASSIMVDTIAFVFGIAANMNTHNGLDATVVNQNMEWHDGTQDGGYHFLRFEGLYKVIDSTDKAYAIHFGRTPNQVLIKLPLDKRYELTNNQSLTVDIAFNLAQLLREPVTIDFSKLPISIMSNDSIQQIISKNAADAFSIQHVMLQ